MKQQALDNYVYYYYHHHHHHYSYDYWVLVEKAWLCTFLSPNSLSGHFA